MKIRFLRLIALVLTAAVLLSGCGMVDFGEYFGAVRSLVDGNAIVPYESMTYERPDMTQLQQTLDAACEAAEGDDVSAILDGIYDFYDAYDWFSTYYALADIHYCADLTDTYWEDEYNYCTQNAATVDAALQELYRALAQSPAREKLEQEEYFGEGFFDSYEDEESVWDETFTAMLEEEAKLQTRYYELSAQAADYQDDTQGYYDACADGMASLLAELIAVRQEIAEYCGYSDYPQFAEDFYFYRDYTAAEEEQLLDDIRRELVPLYRELDAGAWEAGLPDAGSPQRKAGRDAASAPPDGRVLDTETAPGTAYASVRAGGVSGSGNFSAHPYLFRAGGGQCDHAHPAYSGRRGRKRHPLRRFPAGGAE